jgi:hypothetical protein
MNLDRSDCYTRILDVCREYGDFTLSASDPRIIYRDIGRGPEVTDVTVLIMDYSLQVITDLSLTDANQLYYIDYEKWSDNLHNLLSTLSK